MKFLGAKEFSWTVKHETLEELQDRAAAAAQEMEGVVERLSVVAREEVAFESMIIRESVD